MLGASCSGSETSPKFIVPGGGNISGIVQGLMGAHFYSNDAVGSVTLVTNEAGVPITRYVYKPYGELNMELTDVDMDGNGIFYESIYKYNGQEFDYELGVYNYNARNYDQMTGRFMQTDPKFTERVGFDNFDPYLYVYSNPINFTDPNGEAPITQNDLWLLYWAYSHGGTVHGTRAFTFKKSHAYSGDGNKDPFSHFNDSHSFEYGILYFALAYLGNVSPENAVILYLLIRTDALSPPPATAVDRLARRHDREVPGSNSKLGNKEYNRQHIKADNHFIGGYFSTRTWVSNPLDTLVWGTLGAELAYLDRSVRMFADLFMSSNKMLISLRKTVNKVRIKL